MRKTKDSKCSQRLWNFLLNFATSVQVPSWSLVHSGCEDVFLVVLFSHLLSQDLNGASK